MAKAPKEDTRSQRERYIEAAREVGATEDEDSFRQRLKAVAGANSVAGAKKPKPGKEPGK